MRTLKTTAAVSIGALAIGALSMTPSMATPQPVVPPASSTMAQAPTDPAPAHAWGEVVSRINLNVRAHPTTKSAVVGSYAPHAHVKIKCKRVGENVLGNNRWYKVADHAGWVAARYVKNRTHVPWC